MFGDLLCQSVVHLPAQPHRLRCGQCTRAAVTVRDDLDIDAYCIHMRQPMPAKPSGGVGVIIEHRTEFGELV